MFVVSVFISGMTSWRPTALPPWVTPGAKTIVERGAQWEGQRWKTASHLYLFKYHDLTPPWLDPSTRVYYCRYKLPEDASEQEVMLHMLTPEPELHWKPFVTLVEQDSDLQDAHPTTPFVLIHSEQPVLLEAK